MNKVTIDTNEQKLALASQLQAFQLTDLYQFLIKPLLDEKSKLPTAYKMKIEKAQYFDGYCDGIDKVFQIMYQIETEAETAREAIKLEAERAERNKPPEDSSEL